MDVSAGSTSRRDDDDPEVLSGQGGRGLSRRTFATAAAASAASLLGGWPATAAAASRHDRVGDGFGSASTAPHLPKGFDKTFTSHVIRANGIHQHAVIGGDGPPLLLVHGWPQNWYAWRLLMPELARRFTVVAVDQRGIGLTSKPQDGYDSDSLADDLAALMDELGHERFAVVGHDTGYLIGYALAADHRDRVARFVGAELPGPPGVVPGPLLFLDDALNNRLWHIPFNRVDDDLIVDMVRSNADAYYRYEFTIQGGGVTLPECAIEYYVKLYNRSKHTLRGTFGLYRAWAETVAQNSLRKDNKLMIPILGIGGANSWGPAAAGGIRPAASDVHSLVIPGVGHRVAEQAPKQMLAGLLSFLEPYRTGKG